MRSNTTNNEGLIKKLIDTDPNLVNDEYMSLAQDHAKLTGKIVPKSVVLAELSELARHDDSAARVLAALRKKPIRSLSGITSVTVLTKPYRCPGECVFCPVDVRMPKSYIASEPGAQRAGRLGFDPYAQMMTRLKAYESNGHPISKIELIVLGGTWTAYPRNYQVWFIKRCFDAMNEYNSKIASSLQVNEVDWDEVIEKGKTYNEHVREKSQQNYLEEKATLKELQRAHEINESASVRCVGLSIETRPDEINNRVAKNIRQLGVTKVQIGIQSLDDELLAINKRGHDSETTISSINVLRSFGFKIQVHWMPNLVGATPDSDIHDFSRLFNESKICPDELKVYPCVLIKNTELESIAEKGGWKPYSEKELAVVLSYVVKNTAPYCRISRVIRDIPSFEILEGNKKGNLRQLIEKDIATDDMCDIRAREIRGDVVDSFENKIDIQTYTTGNSTEYFIQMVTATANKILGFCRLSIPVNEGPIDELKGCALIRELHVYGQSTVVGQAPSAVQHSGTGESLVERAMKIVEGSPYKKVAVISAIGTRKYWQKIGFSEQAGGLYQYREVQF